MAIRKVDSPQVSDPPPNTWSNCLVVNGIAYLSGMTARGPDGNIEGKDEYEQSRLIFAKIRHLVEAAGGTMADVVKVTIFVVNIARREEVWRARREVFTGNFPASTLVEVRKLATPDTLVEIEAVAHPGATPRVRGGHG